MKHAFLIMAHHQESVLKALLQALDNDRVDIFVHIDKKSTIDINELKNVYMFPICSLLKE